MSDSVSNEQSVSKLRRPLMIAGPVLALAVAAYIYVTGGRYEETDDAYVRAAQISISANVAGRVSELAIRDNQRVNKGDLLFRLDERPFLIAVDEAQARLASAKLEVESLKATYRQRLADRSSAQSTLDYQTKELARQQGLLEPGISSQAQVEKAQVSRDAARQDLESAREQITAVLARLGGDPNIAVDDHPSVQQAQAALDRAKLNLSYTTITAPSDGIVTKVEQLQVGDYLNAATPAFALVSSQNVWIEANFKEVQLTHMAEGQLAEVMIDAYPGHKLEATVVSVSPGTGAEFSLLPAENASGNWVKVVQRLPVRLELKTAADIPLRAGLSANVEVDTRRQRTLFGLRSDTVAEPATETVAATDR
ncbi:HlyD family secretion protein [Steroidobacter flavus]|uniref:HlyD family secretion protein n=1 Tax=Steroidobacter flavus TaxID=1842136 RepID=UPI0036D22B38